MSNQRDTVLDIEGMTCRSCIRHVTAALTDLDGVGAVDVQLRDGTATIRHDAAEAPVAQLVEALARAGYPSRQRPT